MQLFGIAHPDRGGAGLVPAAFGAMARAMLPVPVRRLRGRFDREAGLLGQLGPLEVRLARSNAEVRAAQELRYRVFYEEMSAQPTALQRLIRRDKDAFDRYCDHLLVIDRERTGDLSRRIVGTYRLMRQEAAELAGGFYTAAEFDIAPMLARHPGKRFLELGRSCVLKDYRGKRTVELLWQGIWAYVRRHGVDVLFGCASLAGTDPARLAAPLAFLREHAVPPPEWRVQAVPARRAPASPAPDSPDPRRALAALPPLLKGYLRLGGHIGEDAVVDHQFGTTDVLVVLPVSAIHPRYVEYYGDEGGRFVA